VESPRIDDTRANSGGRAGSMCEGPAGKRWNKEQVKCRLKRTCCTTLKKIKRKVETETINKRNAGRLGTTPSMLRVTSTCDLLMGFTNRGTPLQNSKVWGHVRRREERMNGLRMSVRILRRKVHHQ
jgi:hypothetical protein